MGGQMVQGERKSEKNSRSLPRTGRAVNMEFVFGHYYFIRASWGARPETPEALAARFLKNIDLLSAIDPLLALWLSGVNGPKKLEAIRDRYAQIVAARISKDDWGEPEPIYG